VEVVEVGAEEMEEKGPEGVEVEVMVVEVEVAENEMEENGVEGEWKVLVVVGEFSSKLIGETVPLLAGPVRVGLSGVSAKAN
jgi:hypothetical protein